MLRQADLLVVVGPSGSGKSTLIQRLIKEFPKCFGYSVSHTTRAMREGEVNGQSYHFIDAAEFGQLVYKGEFVEHAIVHETMYGTSHTSIRAVHAENKICLMDIDIVGAQNLRKQPDLRSIVCWVQAPTLDINENRLRKRGTETEERISKRLKSAVLELQYHEDHATFFDFSLVNDDLETCYAAFRESVMSLGFTVGAHSV